MLVHRDLNPIWGHVPDVRDCAYLVKIHLHLAVVAVGHQVGNQKGMNGDNQGQDPTALLKFHLLSAQGLSFNPTSAMVGKAPDAYALITVGNTITRSATQPKTTRPRWDVRFDFEVYNLYATDVQVELQALARHGSIPFSKGQNETLSLGRVVIPMASLDFDQLLDDWYPLNFGEGKVRIRLELLEYDTKLVSAPPASPEVTGPNAPPGNSALASDGSWGGREMQEGRMLALAELQSGDLGDFSDCTSDGEESDEDGEQAGRGSGLAKAEL